MEGYWIVRTYEAGNVGEKTKFFVPGARPTRSQRRLRDAARKQAQNEYSAEKALARLLNANFTEGDLLVGLDYSDDGLARLEAWALRQGLPMETEEERLDTMRAAAEHELQLMIRRVKRELDKLGLPLRYVAVTSDMDGDTGETVRVHHHLVVDRAVRDVFVEKWVGLGGVDWKPLSPQMDYTPLASYLIRQVRRVPDHKKYISSRNLLRVEPKDRIAMSEAEVRVPKGGVLLFREAYHPGLSQYIRYILPENRRRVPAGAQRSGSGGKRTSAQAPNRGAEVPLGCKGAGAVFAVHGNGAERTLRRRHGGASRWTSPPWPGRPIHAPRMLTDPPATAAWTCTGVRPARGRVLRWEWCGAGCPPPPGPGW